MSNLGWYQKGVWLAKKVGGPKKMALLIAAGGYICGKIGELSIKQGIRIINKYRDQSMEGEKPYTEKGENEYKVKAKAVDDQGLKFNSGDTFRILETDKDSILIEKAGEPDNPYVVSSDFLRSISDYE